MWRTGRTGGGTAAQADEGSERTSGRGRTMGGRVDRQTGADNGQIGGQADVGGRARGWADDEFPKVKLLIGRVS